MDDFLKAAFEKQKNVGRSKLISIATASPDGQVIQDLMATDITTQLRAFTLSQAKAELLRVIQLTDSLSELEDTYIRRALEDKEGMDLKSLADTLSVISGSLNRSMSMINSITNDKNLQLIVDQSTQIVNNVNTNVTNILSDRTSREKLRSISTQLLSAINESPSRVINAEPIEHDAVFEELVEVPEAEVLEAEFDG